MAEKVTEEQANEALQTLLGSRTEAEPAPAAEPVAVEAAPVEAEEAAPAVEETAPETEAPADDDLASLKKRLEAVEASAKKDQEHWDLRMKALQDRNATSEKILRDRMLRKATVADRALKALQQSRSETGVPEAEVDQIIRELQGTMNPDSTSYAPPPPQANGAASEEQALVLNSFLNQRGMTEAEADTFGKWIQTEAATAMSPYEQAVANESLGGFLSLAYHRWQAGLAEKGKAEMRQDAAAAVRAVQRTQKAAARAATAPTSAARRQPQAAQAMDPSKLTKDDVSALLRQTIEQYR